MSTDAQLLNEAVMEQDLDMVKTIIGNQKTKHYAALVMLESIVHMDRIADDRDWAWLLDEL